jgi:MscS family membrane protein
MSFRVRILIACLLAGLGAWIGLTGALAQDAPPAPATGPAPAERAAAGADSPRSLFEGFFGAVNDATKRGRPERMKDAVSFLDLSEVPEGDREAAGREGALQLKEVLDYHGKVETGSLPDAAAIGAKTTWTLRTAMGPVTAAASGGRWTFTPDTVFRAAAMREAFAASGASRYEVFSLRKYVPGALEGSALWLHHWQWIGLVLLFLLAWIAHRVVAFSSHLVLSGILRRRGWGAESSLQAERAGRPIGLFAVAVVIVVGTPFLELPLRPVPFEWFSLVVGKFFASLGGVLICYGLADVVGAKLAEAAAKTESKLDDQLVPLVRKSIKILVTAGGLLFILDNLNFNITSLLTGLGVAGLGFAFAAQDTIANLFGSVTVFLDKPFQVGDWINVNGIDGTVEEVGFRSTRLRTFYDSVVSLPNSKVATSPVDNYGRRTFRRFRTVIGIRYDTPPRRIEAFCAGIRGIVGANPNMRQEGFYVHLNDWGASSLEILVHVFFQVPDWGAELRERQNFMIEVIRLAGELGVGFAFPTQTVHLESTPEKPRPPEDLRPLDELDAVLRRFGKGGEKSVPHGAGRWSTASGAPADGANLGDDGG